MIAATARSLIGRPDACRRADRPRGAPLRPDRHGGRAGARDARAALAEGEAERAAAACFHAWLSTRGGTGPGELVAAMSAIREAIERHGESRFRNLDADEPSKVPVRDLLGYRFSSGGALAWGFTSTGWRDVLAGIADPIARGPDAGGARQAADHAERPRLPEHPQDRWARGRALCRAAVGAQRRGRA